MGIANKLGKYLKSAYEKQIKSNFDKESFDKTRWKPLKRPRSKRRNRSGKILQDTGRFKSSIRISFKKSNLTLYGKAEYYGWIHNTGNPENNLPIRQWVGLTDKIMDDITKIFADDLRSVTKRRTKSY